MENDQNTAHIWNSFKIRHNKLEHKKAVEISIPDWKDWCINREYLETYLLGTNESLFLYRKMEMRYL